MNNEIPSKEHQTQETTTLATDSSVAQLMAEVDHLRKYIANYNSAISKKMDLIEKDIDRMEAENARLITLKDALSVERDACVALALKLAMIQGMKVGVAPGNIAVLDLPSGQVSWTFQGSEAHLFEELPPYTEALENLNIEETYSRIMNPGLAIQAE